MIDFDVPAEPRELDGEIFIVIQDRPTHGLKTDFDEWSNRVVVIINAAFAARAKLNDFAKCVLRRRG